MIRKKHIATLLLISFSVLIGHSIIPHHHHPDSMTGQKCPLEHNDQQSAGEDTKHCHAFNGLAFFNAGIASIQNNHYPTAFFVEVQSPDLIVPQLVSNIQQPLKFADPSVVPVESIGLRGPPATT